MPHRLMASVAPPTEADIADLQARLGRLQTHHHLRRIDMSRAPMTASRPSSPATAGAPQIGARRRSTARQGQRGRREAHSAQQESLCGSLYREIATILSASAIVG
jgi:hypothetical protein